MDNAPEHEKKPNKGKKPTKEDEIRDERRTTHQQNKHTTYPSHSRPRYEVMQTKWRATDRAQGKYDVKEEGQSKYCQFHKWTRHKTEECWALKDEIDQLIKSGAPRRPTEGPCKEDRCREDHYKRREPDKSSSPDRRRRRRMPDKQSQRE